MNVLNFLGFDCCIAKRHYANGVIALELIAAETDDNINNDTFPVNEFVLQQPVLVMPTY